MYRLASVLCKVYKRDCLETLELFVSIIDSHYKILAREGHYYICVLDNLAEAVMTGREQRSKIINTKMHAIPSDKNQRH